ncbi:hypothetical protein LC613_43230 [Nostoc sphaeroides CHAB 2801]|uniref:hypothetical protein n=1 Tax=Nostoc sphaeroides TaxID=446679 RepID=UPI001E5CED1A|nr:hypothetical protein [Nostoc sphaeroides]MCC5634218.1 hypothetical protein [Nostoc sphaeroides CHAB 2801]
MSFSGKKLLKSLKLLLLILGCSFFISLLLALIHIILTINITSAILGLTLLISSIITHFWNQNTEKNKHRLEPIKQVEVIANNQRIVETTAEAKVNTTDPRTVNTKGSTYIDTGSGNYNKEIRGDYIQGNSIGRDLVTKNITIEGQPVEISSDYSQTLGDLKDILNEMMVKSSNVGDAISHFAEELIQELRKQPEVKVNLNETENSSDQELVNKIIIDLLTKSYDQISQITRITRTNQIQNLSNSRDLEYVEYYIDNESDRETREYNGYIIHLAKDHDNMWSFRIQRQDSNFLNLSSQRRTRSKDNAIGKAKSIIDKDRMSDWKSINPPE